MIALCIDHKLELFKRGASLAGLAIMPTVPSGPQCEVCNGNYEKNHALWQRPEGQTTQTTEPTP